ncbi:MAG: insulinase family protein, partial [Hyphomicrobiaceae bacterium]
MMIPASIVRRSVRVATVVLATIFLLSPVLVSKSGHAMEIQDVTSLGGIKAWLVEEHGLPLIAVKFGFSSGSTQDPDGKEGVANLLTVMLDEGAGDLKSAAFQERMEELAVKMSFDAGRDTVSGT